MSQFRFTSLIILWSVLSGLCVWNVYTLVTLPLPWPDLLAGLIFFVAPISLGLGFLSNFGFSDLSRNIQIWRNLGLVIAFIPLLVNCSLLFLQILTNFRI